MPRSEQHSTATLVEAIGGDSSFTSHLQKVGQALGSPRVDRVPGVRILGATGAKGLTASVEQTAPYDVAVEDRVATKSEATQTPPPPEPGNFTEPAGHTHVLNGLVDF